MDPEVVAQLVGRHRPDKALQEFAVSQLPARLHGRDPADLLQHAMK